MSTEPAGESVAGGKLRQQQLKPYGGRIVVGTEPGGDEPQPNAGEAGRNAVCANMVGTLR